MSGICIIWVKIFHGIEYQSICLSIHPVFGRFQWGLRGYIQNVGVLDNSSCNKQALLATKLSVWPPFKLCNLPDTY